MRKLSIYGPGLIVLGTALVVLVAGPSAVWRLTDAQTRARIVQARESLDANPILEQLNQAYRDIAALVEPSVVHISTERVLNNDWGPERIVASTGSGWVYDDEGHIVTNYHVVEDAGRIDVQLNTGRIREGEFVGGDRLTDIAVIKIAGGGLFPARRAGADQDADFRPVQQGDLVFAFGSPFDFRFSMSSGVVSGMGRSVGIITDARGQPISYENFIQVDAAINPGNSGGPLTDARGQVIGMNTAIATGNGNQLEEGQFGGVGLAIPIEMIEPAVQQIIATGDVQKGFLGVSVADGERPIGYEVSLLGFRGDGLLVGRIDVDSPAFDAGLRVGDVITHILGRPVATLSEADAILENIRPDDAVEIFVWRFEPEIDEDLTSVVTLPGSVADGLRGIWLLQLDESIDNWLALQGFTGRGVNIIGLEAGRPARAAGLQHRDVVTHVNDEPAASVAQLRSLVSSLLPGDVARLRVWRYEPLEGEGRNLTIEVHLDRVPIAAGNIPRQRWTEGARRLGLATIDTATPALTARYGVAYHRGVLVEAVVEGSELDGVIEPGSIIVAVMDRPVGDLDAFFERLDNYDLRPRYGARVTFVRPDGERGQTILRLQ